MKLKIAIPLIIAVISLGACASVKNASHQSETQLNV